MTIKEELQKMLLADRDSSTNVSKFFSLRELQQAFDDLNINADINSLRLHGVDFEFEIFFTHDDIKYTFMGCLMDLYMQIYKY